MLGRERERERGREGGREGERERESDICIYMCIYIYIYGRDREFRIQGSGLFSLVLCPLPLSGQKNFKKLGLGPQLFRYDFVRHLHGHV